MMRRLAVLLALALSCATTAWAQTADFTPQQRDAIKAIVRELIQQEPELVLEALRELELRETQQTQQRTQKALVERRSELERDAGDPVIGNPNGDVTLVEFFDYRCQYCKQVTDTVFDAVRSDGKVRLVLKELPILGRDSVTAAQAALAAQAQGKYAEFHRKLMTHRGPFDLDSVMKLAGDVGLDTARLKSDMAKPEIEAKLKRNLELARALDIKGTPGFVIGKQVLPGAVDAVTLRAAIRAARAS